VLDGAERNGASNTAVDMMILRVQSVGAYCV